MVTSTYDKKRIKQAHKVATSGNIWAATKEQLMTAPCDVVMIITKSTASLLKGRTPVPNKKIIDHIPHEL